MPYPKNINSEYEILFYKGEACALPLITSLRKNLDFARSVRECLTLKTQHKIKTWSFVP